MVERLEKIIEMRNSGEITKEEADKLKMELIENIGGGIDNSYDVGDCGS